MTRRAVAAGADGYLQKGASISRIISFVREIADGSAEERPAMPSLTLVPEDQLPTEPDHRSAGAGRGT